MTEKEKITEYCIQKGYNVEKLDGLIEDRLERFIGVGPNATVMYTLALSLITIEELNL